MKFINFSFIFFSLIGVIFQNKIYPAVENAKFPNIITNNQGQYVYDLWTKNDSLNDIIQIASSSNYAANWNAAISLSVARQNAKTPSFTTDFSEQNIYVIWARSNGVNDIIQFSRSLNFAQNFSTPQDLSAIGQNAKNPQLTTDFNGDKVYAIWARSNGSEDIIQFSKSLDFGNTFSSSSDLSTVGQNAKTPQITTNVDGRYICTIWVRSDGTNDIIQFKNSADYGATWNAVADLSDVGENAKDPRILTNGNFIYTVWARQNSGIGVGQIDIDVVQFRKSQDGGQTFSYVIDLSPNTFSANIPKIVTSSDGKYVFITWYMSNGRYTDAHVIVSNDYGEIFTAPYVLNKYGQNCQNTDIATDNNGKNIYVVWTRSNGFNDIVQLGRSTDYGATWTTYGLDLSQSGQNAKNPRVSTNQLGNEVYVTWARFDGTKDVIQEADSNDYGTTFSAPITISD